MPLPARPLRLAVGAALAGLWVAQTAGAWQAVDKSRHGRDFATYYYATQVALSGGDPYDTKALSRAARDDGTRRKVHPYFYPPPFLLSTLWVAPLSLHAAYQAWFWLNLVFLGGTLVALRRWLKAPWLLLLGVAALLTPLPDSLKMGQANPLVGLLVVVGLWRGSGVAMGAAGMAKMSPALYLVGWLLRGRWRPAAAAAATAVGLSLLTLPLVGLDAQLRFFTEVLPGFSTGEYHGLTVPITLPANHSIPDLFNQALPGPDDHHLSKAAALLSRFSFLMLLALLAQVLRQARGRLSVANAYAALSILLLITPVYTYEHHLSLLVFPLAASGTALVERRLGPRWWALWVPSAFFVAWPLYWMKAAKQAAPALEWVIQESKFAGLIGLAVVCVAASIDRRGAARGEDPPSVPPHSDSS